MIFTLIHQESNISTEISLCYITPRLHNVGLLPVIMLGMKSLCPGASNNVITLLSVSNRVWATSIVTPRALEHKKMIINAM